MDGHLFLKNPDHIADEPNLFANGGQPELASKFPSEPEELNDPMERLSPVRRLRDDLVLVLVHDLARVIRGDHPDCNPVFLQNGDDFPHSFNRSLGFWAKPSHCVACPSSTRVRNIEPSLQVIMLMLA